MKKKKLGVSFAKDDGMWKQEGSQNTMVSTGVAIMSRTMVPNCKAQVALKGFLGEETSWLGSKRQAEDAQEVGRCRGPSRAACWSLPD